MIVEELLLILGTKDTEEMTVQTITKEGVIMITIDVIDVEMIDLIDLTDIANALTSQKLHNSRFRVRLQAPNGMTTMNICGKLTRGQEKGNLFFHILYFLFFLVVLSSPNPIRLILSQSSRMKKSAWNTNTTNT